MTLDDNQVVVSEDTATIIDVLVNDTDADSLFIDSFSVSQHGAITIKSNQIVYTPDSIYVGIDSFNYSVSDGFGGYSKSTVKLIVSADTNRAPTAVISGTITSRSGPSVVLSNTASSVDFDGSIALNS